MIQYRRERGEMDAHTEMLHVCRSLRNVYAYIRMYVCTHLQRTHIHIHIYTHTYTHAAYVRGARKRLEKGRMWLRRRRAREQVTPLACSSILHKVRWEISINRFRHKLSIDASCIVATSVVIRGKCSLKNEPLQEEGFCVEASGPRGLWSPCVKYI